MAEPVNVPDRRPAVQTAELVPVPALVVDDEPRRLDPERLDVYRVALEFQVLAAGFCRRRGLGALRDQLDRASVSIVLNIAEGAGRVAPAQKAQFYTIARGSAVESGAALDLLLLRGLPRAAGAPQGAGAAGSDRVDACPARVSAQLQVIRAQGAMASGRSPGSAQRRRSSPGSAATIGTHSWPWAA